MSSLPLTLGEVAQICRGKPIGELTAIVSAVASIENISNGALTFVSHSRFLRQIPKSKEGVYLIKPEWEEHVRLGVAVDNPTQAFRYLLEALYPYQADGVIQASAIVADTAAIGTRPTIGHYTCVADGVEIGDNVVIGSHCVIGKNVKIASNTRIDNHVIIHRDCLIGRDCVIADGVVIGGQGFGFSFEGGIWEPILQIGRVVVGNRVFIGNNSCVDRGAINDTVIEDNVIIDNLVHIAHNVRIGRHSAMAAGVGVAGSTTIGEYCMFGGQVGVSGHLDITDGVQVNGGAKVLQSVKEPGTYAGSFSVLPAKQWNRLTVYVKKIETLFKRERKRDRKK